MKQANEEQIEENDGKLKSFGLADWSSLQGDWECQQSDQEPARMSPALTLYTVDASEKMCSARRWPPCFEILVGLNIKENGQKILRLT